MYSLYLPTCLIVIVLFNYFVMLCYVELTYYRNGGPSWAGMFKKLCYQKTFRIVFSLRLRSARASSIGLVLVMFLFLNRVRDRDTTIFLQCTMYQCAFTWVREEMLQSVHSNIIIAFSLPFLLLIVQFILVS